MQVDSNTPLISTNHSPSTQQNSHVDESLFVPQGQLPDEAYIDNGKANIFFAPTTPEKAWQQYAFGNDGNMTNVATTIPAGYQDVTTQLDDILADGSIEIPNGMTIRFAIPETNTELGTETAEEPMFIVENINNKALTKQIEDILNSSKNQHFKESYLALDKLTAAENTQLAQQRDSVVGYSEQQESDSYDPDRAISYGYEQTFSIKLENNHWKMDANLQRVELMRLEKVTP